MTRISGDKSYSRYSLPHHWKPCIVQIFPVQRGAHRLIFSSRDFLLQGSHRRLSTVLLGAITIGLPRSGLDVPCPALQPWNAIRLLRFAGESTTGPVNPDPITSPESKAPCLYPASAHHPQASQLVFDCRWHQQINQVPVARAEQLPVCIHSEVLCTPPSLPGPPITGTVREPMPRYVLM